MGLQIQWSLLDAQSYTYREGSPASTSVADFASTIDTYRDITARFPVAIPPWARLTPMDAATLDSTGWLQRSNAVVLAHAQGDGGASQVAEPAYMDLSGDSEFIAPLRMLLAGSPQLPVMIEAPSWSAAQAGAVVQAALAEASVITAARFDSSLTDLLAEIQSGAASAANSVQEAY